MERADIHMEEDVIRLVMVQDIAADLEDITEDIGGITDAL